MLRARLGQAAMAAQNLGDRARGGDVRLPAILERPLDFPPAQTLLLSSRTASTFASTEEAV
jgi:hypothetical protein